MQIIEKQFSEDLKTLRIVNCIIKKPASLPISDHIGIYRNF